jgi:hypothetical protein
MEEEELLTFESKLDLFFKSPEIYVAASKSSTLHLLRRDIYRCMGYTIASDKNIMWIKDNKINAIIWSRSGTWFSLGTKTPLISKNDH